MGVPVTTKEGAQEMPQLRQATYPLLAIEIVQEATPLRAFGATSASTGGSTTRHKTSDRRRADQQRQRREEHWVWRYRKQGQISTDGSGLYFGGGTLRNVGRSTHGTKQFLVKPNVTKELK